MFPLKRLDKSLTLITKLFRSPRLNTEPSREKNKKSNMSQSTEVLLDIPMVESLDLKKPPKTFYKVSETKNLPKV